MYLSKASGQPTLHLIQPTWGAYHKCLAGESINGNGQVLTRINGARRNIDGQYGTRVPCMTMASSSTSWVSTRESSYVPQLRYF